MTDCDNGDNGLYGHGWFDRHGHVDKYRKNLPHWAQGSCYSFVTFRTADSLPQCLYEELTEGKQEWINNHPVPWDYETEREYYVRFVYPIGLWLDKGHGACVLRRPVIADICVRALQFYDGRRYHLNSYVIMPNHVHLLLRMLPDQVLHKVVGALKGYTGRAINRLLGQSGHFGQSESYDTLIRNAGHFEHVRSYIHRNVRHGGIRWML